MSIWNLSQACELMRDARKFLLLHILKISVFFCNINAVFKEKEKLSEEKNFIKVNRRIALAMKKA